jgi:hypothetical protein
MPLTWRLDPSISETPVIEKHSLTSIGLLTIGASR